MRIGYRLAVLGLFFTLACGGGCNKFPAKNIEAFMRSYEVDTTAETYILQPPDTIEVHCAKIPEIDMQQQVIRPDGIVTFEGLGALEAAGKTPEQLAVAIREAALRLYTLTDEKAIDVRINVFKSKVYYVLGEVRGPGPKVYTGRDTAVRAIAEARPEVTAWISRIRVIRPSVAGQKKAKIFILNFKRVMARGDLSKDVLLSEGDIIYVPPTPLSALAMVIEEFVRPIGRALSPVYRIEMTRQLFADE